MSLSVDPNFAPLVAGAFIPLALALFLMFTNREERTLRDRVMTQSGRARVPVRIERQNLISRKVRRQTPMARLSAWLGLNGDQLPMRRLPVPLVLVLSGVAGGLVAWVATMAAPPGASLPAGLVAAFATLRFAFKWELDRHHQTAFKQIPDALGLMVRAVRSGLPIAEAVRSVAREMPEPTRSEFQRMIAETSLGATLERALWGVFERTGLREYAFLSVVVGLQSQTGGGLAEALENIADIVRKRVAMAAKARALAAQAKASAIVLIALPPFAGAGVSILNPGYLDKLFYDPRGLNLFGMALGSLMLGILAIRQLIRKATAE